MSAGGGGEGGRRGILAKVSLSSVSAAAAEAATFPIDAVKTRLQLNCSPGAGVIRVAGDIVRDDAMYRGISPAFLRHLAYTPLRIVGYEHLRSSLASGGREAGLLEKALAGGVSGIAAQVNLFSGVSYFFYASKQLVVKMLFKKKCDQLEFLLEL
jgi:solute carrier family 25 (mitochondrial uncoupling protein), member 27